MENDKKKSSTLLKSQEKRQHPSQRLKWDSHSMETALPKGLEIIVADWFKLSSVFSVLQTTVGNSFARVSTSLATVLQTPVGRPDGKSHSHWLPTPFDRALE